MRVRKLFSLTVLLVLLTALTGAAGGAPLAWVYIPGGAHDAIAHRAMEGVD